MVPHVDPQTRLDEWGYVASEMPHWVHLYPRNDQHPGGYDDETLTTIAKMACAKCKLIRYEGNFGDGMFGQLLQPVVKRICGQVRVEFKVSGRRRRLLDTLEPVIMQRLVTDTSGLKDKTNQMRSPAMRPTRCPQARRPVDALAHAVQYYTEMLGVDVDAVINGPVLGRKN